MIVIQHLLNLVDKDVHRLHEALGLVCCYVDLFDSFVALEVLKEGGDDRLDVAQLLAYGKENGFENC